MADINLGPAGGLGGIEITNSVIPIGARIKEIHVFAEYYVDALQIVYEDARGNEVYMLKLGGQGGQPHVFTLAADEYLTGISGRCGWFIDQLCFHTNRRISETYGSAVGEDDFEFVAPEGQAVVGFCGRADWFVDALGVVLRPLSLTPPVAQPQPAATAKAPQLDDLQKVEGIGPKIAGLLIADGILDLADLAATPVARLEAILTTAGRRYAIADPATWPEQAALGAQGNWDGLQQLQATLKRGRRV